MTIEITNYQHDLSWVKPDISITARPSQFGKINKNINVNITSLNFDLSHLRKIANILVEDDSALEILLIIDEFQNVSFEKLFRKIRENNKTRKAVSELVNSGLIIEPNELSVASVVCRDGSRTGKYFSITPEGKAVIKKLRNHYLSKPKI